MDCPKCHYKNDDGALTCNLCGELLQNPLKDTGRTKPYVPAGRGGPPGPEARTDSGGHAYAPPRTPPRFAMTGAGPPSPQDQEYCLVCFPLDPVRLSKNRPLTVGRSKSNDLILPVGMVSREHAKVYWNGEAFEIRDLGSSNGTFVNEQKMERQALKEGDQLKIGPYQLKFQAFSGSLDSVGAAEHDLEMTQNITRRDVFEASSTFSGNIAEMGMEEVLQLIDFNKKTGTLEVKAGGKEGRFHFLEGQILAGEFHNSKGESAVARVLSMQSGTFQFHAGKPDVERTIFTPTGRVVLDAMRRLDEIDR